LAPAAKQAEKIKQSAHDKIFGLNLELIPVIVSAGNYQKVFLDVWSINYKKLQPASCEIESATKEFGYFPCPSHCSGNAVRNSGGGCGSFCTRK